MRWRLAILIMAVLGGPAPAQTRPETAASAPDAGKRLNLTLPRENPAVRASKQSGMPGDLPSQRENTKQIQIPLGRSADQGPQGSGRIDDSVARCRAKRTSEEREACEARLDV